MTTELDTLVRRCATCKHWQGDKDKAAAMFAENPTSMDVDRGWPDDGACSKDYDFLEVQTVGDAYTNVYFYANFGCVYWCA